jgi:exonuclease III
LRYSLRRRHPPLHNPPILYEVDKLTIATQNARGLGQGFTGNKKRREMRDLFRKSTPAADIILLQEIKLLEPACLKQARFIESRKGISLWNEGSFSARTTKIKGGTGIIIAERLVESISNHGVLYPGRAQFVTLQLSPNLLIGILNVYGFSEPGPRAMLWNHLAQTELPEANWILAGDFNNIEQASDKQGGAPNTNISSRELEAWNRLLLRLGCRDAHHIGSFVRKSNKAFTWSNGRTDDSLIQSRIDRFYIPIRV